MAKVIRDCIGFAFYVRSMIALENSRNLPNQSDVKLTKSNRDLVVRVFSRFRPFTSVYFEFSSVHGDIKLCSDWPLRLLRF